MSEHALHVSDNELPAGKLSVDNGQFALNTYEQNIYAGGSPFPAAVRDEW